MLSKGTTTKRMLSFPGPSAGSLSQLSRGHNIHQNAILGSAARTLKIGTAERDSSLKGDEKKEPLTADFAVRAHWSDGAYGYFTAGGRVYWNNGERDHKALAVEYKASGERIIYSAVECPQNRNKQHLLEYLSYDKREHDIPSKESLPEWVKALKLNNGARKARGERDATSGN